MSLSTRELAQLRADQLSYWPDECTIQTTTRTRDTQGGFDDSWGDTYENVACRLAPQMTAQGEMVEGDQVQAVTNWVLTVAYDQALTEADRVVHDSETYEVVRLDDTHSNRTAKRAYLKRLD